MQQARVKRVQVYTWLGEESDPLEIVQEIHILTIQPNGICATQNSS